MMRESVSHLQRLVGAHVAAASDASAKSSPSRLAKAKSSAAAPKAQHATPRVPVPAGAASDEFFT